MTLTPNTHHRVRAALTGAQVIDVVHEARTDAGLEAFARWVVSLADPPGTSGAEDRRSITLTDLIEGARAALADPAPDRLTLRLLVHAADPYRVVVIEGARLDLRFGDEPATADVPR